MKRLLLLLLPALFLVGCKDGPTKGDPDAETPPDVTHVRRIGAAGGELVSEDGQVTVRVPAGALSEDVTLEIHRVPAASWPEEANEPQYRPVSSTVYQLLPSGQTFDEPVHIIHRVPPASLSTGNSEPGRFPAAQHVSRTQSGSLERHATTTVHGRSSAAAVGSIRHFSYHWLTLPEEETIGVDPMMNTEEAHEIFVGSELGMEGFEIRSTYEITSEIEIQINVHTLAGDPIVPIPYFGEANPVQDDVRFLAAYAAATGDESARSISILGDPMMYSGLSPDSPFYTYSAPNVRCVDYGSASAFFEVVVKESGDEGLERSIFFEIEIECIGQPIDEIRYPLPAELTARVATPLPPGTADTYAPFGLEPNHMLVALFSDELSDVAPAMAIVNVSAWTNSEWDDPRPPASDFAFVSPPLLTSPPAQPPLVYDAAVRKMASSTDPVVNFVLATSQGVMSVDLTSDYETPTPTLSYSLRDEGIAGAYTSILELDPYVSLEGQYAALGIAGTEPNGAPQVAMLFEDSNHVMSVGGLLDGRPIGAFFTRDQGRALVFLDDGSIYTDVTESSSLETEVPVTMSGGAQMKKPSAVSCAKDWNDTSLYCAVLDIGTSQNDDAVIHVFFVDDTSVDTVEVHHVVTLDVGEPLDADSNIVVYNDYGWALSIFVPSKSATASYHQFQAYTDAIGVTPAFTHGTHLLENCSRSNRVDFDAYFETLYVLCPSEKELVAIRWVFVGAEFPASQTPAPTFAAP